MYSTEKLNLKNKVVFGLMFLSIGTTGRKGLTYTW